MRKLIVLLLAIPLFTSAQWTASSRMTGKAGETIVTNFIRGYIELKNGTRKEGEVQLKVLNGDTVEVRIKPNGGKKEKYPRDQVARFYGVVLLKDLKNDYKNPIKNFHSGSIFLESGEEKKGKVAMGMREPTEHDGSKVYGPIRVKYANENDEVTVHKALGSDIVYVIQNIGGVENHFIRVGRQFIAVGNPDGRFSYFKNPNPTHVREGTTNFTKAAIEEVGQEIAEAAAQAAAERSIEESQKRGEDLGETIGNATVAAMNTAETVNELFTPDEDGAIYFEEYYIVDNKKMTRSIIYKKNIDEVLNSILAGCGLEEKIIDKAGKMKELTEAMVFLEENICD